MEASRENPTGNVTLDQLLETFAESDRKKEQEEPTKLPSSFAELADFVEKHKPRWDRRF